MNTDHLPTTSATTDRIEDAELAEVLEAYLASLEAGRAPPIEELLRAHPNIADRLRDCLSALNLVQQTAASIGDGGDFDPLRGDAPRTLGDFRLLRQIGRGGMGIVYDAEQLSLSRRVALKVLPFAALLDQRQLQRFKNEAHAAAVLRHPNIVSVHYVGCERGVHFYAMELVEGHSLAEVIKELCETSVISPPLQEGVQRKDGQAYVDTQPLAELTTYYAATRSKYFRAVADIGAQIADAIQYAHQQGILHRDLKPSNLMLDWQGKPWVTDFGLAQIQGDHGLTMTGDVLGTLRYMSPEQADGQKWVDHRTDIYSLGATLYELLTLRPALDGKDRQCLLRQLEYTQPARPRALDPQLPKDLETILLKAMAIRPDDRYGSAAELAEDLRCFLEHKPIQARRVGRWQRGSRWIQRHRAVSALLAIIVSLLVTLSIGGPLVAIRYARLAAAEQQARQQSDQTRRDLQRLLTDTLTRVAADLGDMSRTDALRLELVSATIDEYDGLLKQAGDDPSLQFEAAVAYRRLSDTALYDDHNALRLCSRSAKIFEALVQRYPTKVEYQAELAHVYLVLARKGLKLKWFKSPSLAIQHARTSQSIIQRVVEQFPDAPEYQQTIAHSHSVLGHLLSRCGTLDEAREQFISAERTYGELSRRYSDEDRLRWLWAYAKSGLGCLYAYQGDLRAAETELRNALSLCPEYSQLLQHSTFRIGYAEAQVRLGATIVRLRRPPEAEDYLRQAIAHLDDITARFPESSWARSLLYKARMNLADALLADERTEDALATLRKSLASDDSRGTVSDRPELRAITHFQLGRVLWGARRYREAREHFQESFNILHLPPQNPAFDHFRALFYACCPDESLRSPRRALENARRHYHPQDGLRCQVLGIAQYRAGQYREARESLQQAIRLRQGGDSFDFFFLAMTCHALGDHDTARQWNEQGLDHFHGPLRCSISFANHYALNEIRLEASQLLEIDHDQNKGSTENSTNDEPTE